MAKTARSIISLSVVAGIFLPGRVFAYGAMGKRDVALIQAAYASAKQGGARVGIKI